MATRREERLRYIISVYTHQHGKTSDLVIKYYKVLVELHVSIHEHAKAQGCLGELLEIVILRHGAGSSEEAAIRGKLEIVLNKDDSSDIVTYDDDIFDTTVELKSWDMQQIEIVLKMAITYESHGHLLKAEECYVFLWSGLIEYCQEIDRHRHIEIELYIGMINITIEYVRYLQRHHRHEEASSILICVWAEYEEYEFESEIIFTQLIIIGELMRTVNILAIAISVFKKCLSWFESHESYGHVEMCQTLISTTLEEMTITTSKTVTTTTETVLKESFESLLSKSIVTKETLVVCQSLVTLYIENEQWSRAITTATRSLGLIWKLIVTGKGILTLPREWSSEAIEIAFNLAMCHQRLYHYHEAEEVYLRIYQASFKSCTFEDDRFSRSTTHLIRFYEEHQHWDKVIHVYQELLAATRTHYGKSHSLTIRYMYELGTLCTAHGHAGGVDYFEEIIETLNDSSIVCHHDAFRATEIMCRVYYEQGYWTKLKSICATLWNAWIARHYAFDSGFIQDLYSRYIYVLERHFHAEYEFVRRLSLEYYDTCVLLYGSTSYVTVKALIELASISMRSTKYTHEAITHYEEIIKITTTTTTTITTTTETEMISTTTLNSIKENLSRAYIHVCSGNQVSVDTTERAFFVLTERFESLKLDLGCAHSETLIVLRELINLHLRLKQTQSTTIVVKTLLDHTVLIVSQKSTSRTLFEAARTIGLLYHGCGLIEEGKKLLRELHLQIVFGSRLEHSACGYGIDTSLGRGSYVFLVTFEETLHGSVSVNYSKVMAELLTETVLLESWMRCVETQKSLEIILTVGAKLFVFLEKTSRKEQIKIFRGKIHSLFFKQWGTVVKSSQETSLLFLTGLLRTLNTTRKIKIGDAACRSSNGIVDRLVREGDFQKAYEVSLYAFQFGEHQKSYHQLVNIGHGFKLSSLMTTPVKDIEKQENVALQAKMLELSRKVITVVLKACKDSKVNIVRMKLAELSDLVHLLGTQKNYTDLEVRLSPISLNTVILITVQSGFSHLFGRLARCRSNGPHRQSYHLPKF